jgi:thermolysin
MNLRKKPKKRKAKILKKRDNFKRTEKFNLITLFIVLFIITNFLTAIEFREGKNKYQIIKRCLSDKPLIELGFSKETKSFGITNIFYKQKYKGVYVFGGKLIEHKSETGRISYSGNIYDKIIPKNKILLNKERVIKIINENFEDFNIKKINISLLPLENGDYYSYIADIINGEKRYLLFIDSENGKIIDKIDNIQFDEIPKIGKGIGVLGDIKKFSSVLSEGAFWPRDRMRPALIESYDMKWGTDLKKRYFPSDDDNIWENRPLVDAHVYSGFVYDMYYKVFSRNGINNKNMKIKSFVNYGNKYNNAFWNGDSIVYGSGDETTYYPFSTAIDIVAHEYTHGITEWTSGLIYENESGALNEAFSDIMGVYTEFYYQKKGIGYLRADWWIGEDLFKSFGSILRSIRAPYGESGYPSHYNMRYTGKDDNGGVHYNSTIVSYVFYLLSEGGINEYSLTYITGIGMEKAIKIFYNAFTGYLPETANFHKARVETIRAAQDLYGINSNEVQQLKRAWDSVGVE